MLLPQPLHEIINLDITCLDRFIPILCFSRRNPNILVHNRCLPLSVMQRALGIPERPWHRLTDDVSVSASVSPAVRVRVVVMHDVRFLLVAYSRRQNSSAQDFS